LIGSDGEEFVDNAEGAGFLKPWVNVIVASARIINISLIDFIGNVFL
jgi:hypothetical protein